MNSISKNIIFYVTIVEKNLAEHSFLRSLIHRVLPQAIVESIYSDEEAIHYFNNCASLPHLLFLDQSMLQVSGRDTLQLIKRVNGFNEVPIVFLTNISNEPQQISSTENVTGHFYSKPYEAQDLLNIVGSVNSKWLA